MSFCPKCGTQIEEGQKFCPNCGIPIEGDKQSQNSFADGVNSIVSDIQNTEDHSAGYAPADISANKGLSILAYINILVLVPLIACKNSPFARFHSNQGLVLFILEVICNVVLGCAGLILSIVGLGFIVHIISTVVNLCLLALCILGIVYTAEGKAKELPIIGKIKILK